MDPMNLLILGGIFIGVVGGFVLMAVLKGGGKSRSSRLIGIQQQGPGGAEKRIVVPKAKQQEFKKLVAERVLRPLSGITKFSGGSQSKLVEQLVHAGIRKKGVVEVFLGAKIALTLAIPAATAGVLLWRARVAGNPADYGQMIMYCAGALIVGLMLPTFWLKRKVRHRQELVRFALPDALDLLVVCVESGLALDAALVRISREMEQTAPELSEELTLMNLEVSAGKPREECLRNFGLRTGVDEAKSLAARLIQTIRYGTNLAHSLRIHAESLRQKRRQQAEERAAKTTIKMLFPLVIFIFPAIFVVILGPAMIMMKDAFG